MVKIFRGVVVSVRMNKTVVVRVERRKAHPLYRKVMRLSKRYHVHDEVGAKMGDKVVFVETRPLSKTKKWRVVEIMAAGEEKQMKKKKDGGGSTGGRRETRGMRRRVDKEEK